MQLFLRYIRQRLPIFSVSAAFCLVFIASFALSRLPLKALLYPMLLCAALGLMLCAVDFLHMKGRHERLQHIRSLTDALESSFPKTARIEDEDYREIIRLLGEEHRDYRTQTMGKYEDMVDYYTVWAHQIKTPIASMRLQLQNEDSPLSRRLSTDLGRVEQYADMVLTFLRLDSGSTDYVFREYELDPIIRQSVKKFSREFIDRKLRLDYAPTNIRIVTDEKWLAFVIEQVLSNALKYTQTGGISISLEENRKLRIRDTGMGIAPEDLPRIFENGYTGYNGRRDKRASGIGLYLCKRICTNLGHGISAASRVDEGTAITIDLAQEQHRME